MGSMLSQVGGVLSMAAGGLYIAKGAQELQCCMQGCDTQAGRSSVTGKEALDKAMQDGAKGVGGAANRRQPVDYFRLRFPDTAQAAPVLLHLFIPARARAAGCLDAMLALGTGGLMLLNGMMGLAAAQQAAQNGAAAMDNAGSMASYPGGGTSPTPDATKTDSAKFGGISSNGSQIKLDPALLRTGTANDIMGKFENQFGIGRDSFAHDVLDGQDPRKLLGSAPKNPLSAADMNKAIIAAQNMSAEDKTKALAATPLPAAQSELAAQVESGAGTRGPASGSGKPSKSEELDPLDALDAAASAKAGTEVPGLGLSPEVKAALAARRAEEAKKLDENMSIFQIVHRRYREKAKFIFGYDPDNGGPLKGVGDANGR